MSQEYTLGAESRNYALQFLYLKTATKEWLLVDVERHMHPASMILEQIRMLKSPSLCMSMTFLENL